MDYSVTGGGYLDPVASCKWIIMDYHLIDFPWHEYLTIIRWKSTLLCRGVAVGEEPEVALVVPADQRHAALHHHTWLAALCRRGTADQHVLRQARAVALPGAQQATAVDVCRERIRTRQRRFFNDSGTKKPSFTKDRIPECMKWRETKITGASGYLLW